MLLRVPAYYKEFRCIADRCKDTCCAGWEIDIDEDTYEYYCSLEGEFGEKLRRNMKSGNENMFRMKHGRCPLLNQKNLCEICIELGEEALCEVCTEYPRFTMEYGNVTEKCMALSCEEVGRLVFESKEPFAYEEMNMNEGDFYFSEIACMAEDGDEYEDEYEEEYEEEECEEEECEEDEEEPSRALIEAVESARETVFSILKTRRIRIGQRLILSLRFCEKIQELLNQRKYIEAKEYAERYPVQNSGSTTDITCTGNITTMTPQQQFMQRMRVFQKLEVMEEEWSQSLQHVTRSMSPESISEVEYEARLKAFHDDYKKREYEYEHLLNYFVFRYFMRGVYDYDVLGKMKLAAVSFLCIHDFDVVRFHENNSQFDLEDRIDIARIYSKETEHSEENIERLKQAAEFDPLFSTEGILQQITTLLT